MADKGEALPAHFSVQGNCSPYSSKSSIIYLRSPIRFTDLLLQPPCRSDVLLARSTVHLASPSAPPTDAPPALYFAPLGYRIALASPSTWRTRKPISCSARRRIHTLCIGLLQLRSGRFFFFFWLICGIRIAGFYPFDYQFSSQVRTLRLDPGGGG